jgi:hypothetical protein
MTAPMDPPGFPDPRQYPATNEGLREALKALGTTREQVASTLDRLGIRGRRGDCRTCPVALYLTDVTGGHVLVDVLDVRLGSPADHVLVMLPTPVRDFIDRFDQDYYPGLVDMAVTHAG